MKLRYNPTTRRTELDRTSSGQLFIDFNQAAQSPACRSASRTGAGALAVMKWSIRSERDTWCIEPAVLRERTRRQISRATGIAATALISAGGMELLSLQSSAGQSQLVAVVYYPDLQGRSRWAITALSDVNLAHTPALTLNEVTSGYRRTCAAPAGPTQSARSARSSSSSRSRHAWSPPTVRTA